MLKRPFDLAVSFIAIIAASNLVILIAIWIKLDSPVPVFYRGARVGLHGKPFRIYKFRSMVINADRIGGPSTAGDDPRITMAGEFVRKYKLDELPQFITDSSTHKMVSLIKRTAVSLHLIPGRMKSKQWLKRIFYRKLACLPAELGQETIQKPQRGQAGSEALMPISSETSSGQFKVIYAVGCLP